jgi:hypothetical protein
MRKTIMRHKDLRTTLKYYAGQNLEADAKSIRAIFESKATLANH